MSMPGITGQPVQRRRRADAERNRVRVLDAARELFARGGYNVQMDEVAHRAGVGVGTLYRHFPTKEALLEAASQQRFADILCYYRSVCRVVPEPIDALRLLLTHIAETEARDRAFAIIVEATLGAEGFPSEVRAGLEDELVDLVRRGQAAGRIRRDIAGPDIFSLTCGLASIVHRGSGDWRRYIEIVLDGLRSR